MSDCISELFFQSKWNHEGCLFTQLAYLVIALLFFEISILVTMDLFWLIDTSTEIIIITVPNIAAIPTTPVDEYERVNSSPFFSTSVDDILSGKDLEIRVYGNSNN